MKYGVRVILIRDPAAQYDLHDATLTNRGWERWASSGSSMSDQKPVIYQDINVAHHELQEWIKSRIDPTDTFIVEEMHQ